MRFSRIAILGVSPFGVLALPTTDSRFVHESVAKLPNGWTFNGQAEDSLSVRLSLALKQSRLSELKARLEVTSDPSHPDYGAHLTRDLLKKFQEPDQEGIAAVESWLQKNGIQFALEDSWIRFNTTVGEANRLLDAEFGRYQHMSDSPVLRSKQYSLPSDVADYVDFAYPVTQFMSRPAKRELSPPEMVKRQEAVPKSCEDVTTPDCLVDLYNINYRVPGDSSPVDFAIAGFLDENPNRTQLHEFLAGYSPFRNGNYSSEYNFAVESINGGNDTDNGNGVEAQLDIQYSTPFIQPMNVTYFSTGGRGPYLDENGELRDPSMSNNEPWIEFLEALLRREKIPDVISISYTDNEETIPEAYARRTCDLFMQVGARGSSVLVATGDGGAAGVNFDPCLGEKFRPTFPVDCPYVTGVGATSYYAPAGAASYSSGGFSEYFDRPSWQDSDVTGYIKRINGSHDGWYTPKGRASPDISATGSRFLMKEGWTQKGTSASCPVIASMVALANDKRVRAGKPTLGYLNPLLYSEKLRPAYYDVTVGQTGSCTYTEGRVEFGWEATEGWDAATGLGTIDFSKFIEIVG